MAERDGGGEAEELTTVVSGAVTAVTLLVAFGLMAAGVSYFWVAFPVGFGGVLPMSVGLAKRYQRQQVGAETTEPADPLETVKQRYARGELTDAEFEAEIERVLEAESDVDSRLETESDAESRTDPGRGPGANGRRPGHEPGANGRQSDREAGANDGRSDRGSQREYE